MILKQLCKVTWKFNLKPTAEQCKAAPCKDGNFENEFEQLQVKLHKTTSAELRTMYTHEAGSPASE